MKKLIFSTLFIVLFAFAGWTQKNFEGVINYKIQLVGENADQMGALMPHSYEYNIKGSNLLFRMIGGMAAAMMGDVLVNGDEGTTYMIKHGEEIAYKLSNEDEDEEQAEIPNITKMDEMIEIAGYSCQKYKVVLPNEEDGTQYIWATKEIHIKRPKKIKGSSGMIFIKGLDGFPLKIMTENMGMTIIMSADLVEEKNLNKKDFTVPAHYEIKAFDPETFGGFGE